jgi:hypothetical protein
MGWASYRHPNGAHILAVHNIHGQPHYYEPQGGVGRINQADSDEYFNGAHSWSLSRVDDLVPTDETAKMMATSPFALKDLPHPYSQEWQDHVWGDQ